MSWAETVVSALATADLDQGFSELKMIKVFPQMGFGG